MTSIADLYSIFLKHPDVQTDTRLLSEGCIFFALKGENFNGNDYAIQALEKGAAYAVVDDPNLENKTNCLLVQDTLLALQELSRYHREQLKIPFLAITGSNGKTTTKELVSAVLGKRFNVLATAGNFNNHIGVPLTLLRIRNSHEFAIIEMGANHQKEIEAYCEWARPDYALINNCGKAHLEGFGGIDGVRKGKGELYDFIREQGGTIFRNADYDYLKKMSNGIDKQITYGEYQGEVRGKIYENHPYLSIALMTKGKEQIIPTNLVGDYNLANVMAAVCIGNYFDIPIEEISEAIKHYEPNNNRSEHKVVKGVNVILDAYNANPTSMKAAIESFDKLDNDNKTLIIGAMMELGTESQKEHEAVLAHALNYNWKNIITVGRNFEIAAQKFDLMHFDTAEAVKPWFWNNIGEDDWVYLKGSRLTAMEKIIED